MSKFIDGFIDYLSEILKKYNIPFEEIQKPVLDILSYEAVFKILYKNEYFYCNMDRKTNFIKTFNFTDFYKEELNKWPENDCAHLDHYFMKYYKDTQKYHYDSIMYLKFDNK